MTLGAVAGTGRTVTTADPSSCRSEPPESARKQATAAPAAAPARAGRGSTRDTPQIANQRRAGITHDDGQHAAHAAEPGGQARP